MPFYRERPDRGPTRPWLRVGPLDYDPALEKAFDEGRLPVGRVHDLLSYEPLIQRALVALYAGRRVGWASWQRTAGLLRRLEPALVSAVGAGRISRGCVPNLADLDREQQLWVANASYNVTLRTVTDLVIVLKANRHVREPRFVYALAEGQIRPGEMGQLLRQPSKIRATVRKLCPGGRAK